MWYERRKQQLYSSTGKRLKRGKNKENKESKETAAAADAGVDVGVRAREGGVL